MYTDILKIARHRLVQVARYHRYRKPDIIQVSRHRSGRHNHTVEQTTDRWADIISLSRHHTSKQASYKQTAIIKVSRQNLG